MSALASRNALSERAQGRRLAAIAVMFCGLAVVAAYLLVSRGPSDAVAVLALFPLAWILSRAGGAMAIGVILILVAPYWLTIGTAQASVLRIASLAAAATLLSARRVRLNATDGALILLIAVMTLDWLLQYNQPHAGRILSTELTPVGFYLGGRFLPRRHLVQILRIAVIAGAAAALTVLYEFAVGHSVFVDPTTYVWNATDTTIFRPGGVFGSPPGASTVLSFVFIFGLGCLFGAPRRVKRVLIACLAVVTPALVVAFTRGNLIGVAIGVVVFLWLIRSPLLRPTRAAAAVFVLLAALFLVLPSLSRSTTFQEGILRQGTLTTRESYWTAALPIATRDVHNLIFGIGTASLEAPSAFNDVRIPAEVAATPTVYTTSLHNQYVTTLLEQGLIGLVALLLFLGLAIRSAGRAARAHRDPIAAAVAAAIVAMAVSMTVDTSFLHGPSFALFMLTTGIAAQFALDREPAKAHIGVRIRDTRRPPPSIAPSSA